MVMSWPNSSTVQRLYWSNVSRIPQPSLLVQGQASIARSRTDYFWEIRQALRRAREFCAALQTMSPLVVEGDSRPVRS